MNDKLKEKLIPKRIVFFKPHIHPGFEGFIMHAILRAQSIYTQAVYGEKSQWEHIGIIGNDGLFYESTIGFKGLKWQDGIVISELEERFKDDTKDYEKIGIQELKIPDDAWNKITEIARRKSTEGIHYAFFELIGTGLIFLKWYFTKDPEKRKAILQKKNPFNTKNVYCIAYVSDVIEEAGWLYTVAENSITVVDMGWHTTVPHENGIIEL